MAPRSCAVLAGLALMLGATAVLADDRPPRDLHLVGDHWTPWNPPTEFPEGAKVYTIVRGDTLWDLAAKNLGNPYLWPQIWEKNQYILDAHWIYPGDPLVLAIEAVPVEQVTEAPEAAPIVEGEAAPEEGMKNVESAASAARPPQQLGTEDDIYCSGFVGELEEALPYHITGSEYQVLSPTLYGQGSKGKLQGIYGAVDTVKYNLSLGDVVYLDGGSAAGLVPGAVLTAVQPGDIVNHPLTGQALGRMHRYLGRVRVLAVQDQTAIGEIIQACAPILVGASLRPFEPEPVPLARRTAPRPINDPSDAASLQAAPVIVSSEDDVVSLGQDHVVYIDRGADDDVTPGDIFTIYRMNREGFPPLPIGELAVLSVRSHTAVAKILDSNVAIYLGDRLERK
jgi:hypothetical protein